MGKKVIKIIVFTALILAAGFLVTPKSEAPVEVTVDGRSIEVFIADSVKERQQGLSGVELDEFGADGMLFIFEDYAEREFWMKDMNFTLDMVWIQGDEIVKIETDVQAFVNDQIVRMSSEPFEVDHVLELPAGSVDEYELKVGGKIKY